MTKCHLSNWKTRTVPCIPFRQPPIVFLDVSQALSGIEWPCHLSVIFSIIRCNGESKKLTSRRRLEPETPGHSYQVFLNVLRIQDIAYIVQSGSKDIHLLEQAMNRVFKGCVAIEIVKYSAENKASNKRTELL
jgi:hypothetical protein